MEWHQTDAESLATIDAEMGNHPFAPAEYEIVRRVIYATADFEYRTLIEFSEDALPSGSTALASRSTLIVDGPMVQVGVVPALQTTFANPVYCGMETITRPQTGKSQAAWGIQTLAGRYPEGIFIIGQSQSALEQLLDLLESGDITPALVIATPSGFNNVELTKVRLAQSKVPYISIKGRKGSAVVAAAIANALIDLAWQAYGKTAMPAGA